MDIQEGGLWWEKFSEREQDKKFNLSPTEEFIKALYLYNYMLHSQKINSLEEIENSTPQTP